MKWEGTRRNEVKWSEEGQDLKGFEGQGDSNTEWTLTHISALNNMPSCYQWWSHAIVDGDRCSCECWSSSDRLVLAKSKAELLRTSIPTGWGSVVGWDWISPGAWSRKLIVVCVCVNGVMMVDGMYVCMYVPRWNWYGWERLGVGGIESSSVCWVESPTVSDTQLVGHRREAIRRQLTHTYYVQTDMRLTLHQPPYHRPWSIMHLGSVCTMLARIAPLPQSARDERRHNEGHWLDYRHTATRNVRSGSNHVCVMERNSNWRLILHWSILTPQNRAQPPCISSLQSTRSFRLLPITIYRSRCPQIPILLPLWIHPSPSPSPLIIHSLTNFWRHILRMGVDHPSHYSQLYSPNSIIRSDQRLHAKRRKGQKKEGIEIVQNSQFTNWKRL